MSESLPKLRVIDEEAADSRDVILLGPAGITVEQVVKLPGRADVPERLESEARELFEGRSLEPGVEAILDKPEPVANIELPWGLRDGRVVGIPYGWFVLIFAVLAGAGLWSLRTMRRGEIRLEGKQEAVREIFAREEEESKTAGLLVERVEQVVAAYLGADSPEEMLPWVRHPERVRPLIEEALKRQPKRAMKFTRMTSFQAASLGTKPFWVIRAEVEEGEPQSLLVEQIGESGVQVDWETHAGYQPMDWERFVAERPDREALDFRVKAEPDSFFTHEFADNGRWRCFRLLARDSDEFLFGYAAAGGEVANQLDALGLNSPGQVASVILRLRVLPASGSVRGVIIEKVVAPRWVLLDELPQDAP